MNSCLLDVYVAMPSVLGLPCHVQLNPVCLLYITCDQCAGVHCSCAGVSAQTVTTLILRHTVLQSHSAVFNHSDGSAQFNQYWLFCRELDTTSISVG